TTAPSEGTVSAPRAPSRHTSEYILFKPGRSPTMTRLRHANARSSSPSAMPPGKRGRRVPLRPEWTAGQLLDNARKPLTDSCFRVIRLDSLWIEADPDRLMCEVAVSVAKKSERWHLDLGSPFEYWDMSAATAGFIIRANIEEWWDAADTSPDFLHARRVK
ncbi:hypothetical protein, partial [Pseudonocardia sp. ICBG1142]|uniref:hypothetical protein n=1 Tax=Pseudonocardia sp. ICBG1142 TaxID=2846760 RepID=UPI001CF60C49